MFLAKELAARIPEYASYVETDGLDALASHVREAVKGYHPSGIDVDTAARQIELATMVGAPARTKTLLMGFESTTPRPPFFWRAAGSARTASTPRSKAVSPGRSR